MKKEDKKIKLKALKPNFDYEVDQNNIELSPMMIVDEGNIALGTISDCDLEDVTGERMVFRLVKFKNVNLHRNVMLKHIELMDVRFENCDLSNVDFGEASLYRVEFINCKIIGMNLSDATLRDVTFDHCNGQYAFFSYMNCKQVEFLHCQLTAADFTNATMVNVEFQECALVQVQFNFTALKGIDFTTCDIGGLGVNIPDVKGAVVTPYQALALCELLGLVVK